MNGAHRRPRWPREAAKRSRTYALPLHRRHRLQRSVDGLWGATSRVPAELILSHAMTLNLTLLTADAIYQSADFQLTDATTNQPLQTRDTLGPRRRPAPEWRKSGWQGSCSGWRGQTVRPPSRRRSAPPSPIEGRETRSTSAPGRYAWCEFETAVPTNARCWSPTRWPDEPLAVWSIVP